MRTISRFKLWPVVAVALMHIALVSAGQSDYDGAAVEDPNYDSDFEYVDSEADVKFEVHAESPFSRAEPAVEMTHTHCITRDRERICDCGFSSQDLTVPIFSGNMQQVTIRNCKRVTIRNNTFSNIYNIGQLDLVNIEDLVLQSNSLAFPISDWGHVNILLRNIRTEYIPEHTFSGYIRSLTIDHSLIGEIERFAANGIRSRMQGLVIQDTVVTTIGPSAFKKFTVEEIDINNLTTRGVIPSRFFYGVEVTSQFQIRNSNLTTIHSSAFDMNEVNSFNLLGNNIDELGGEAFRMALLNGVRIRDNQIVNCHPRAFQLMTLNDNYWRHHTIPMRMQMNTNTIGTADTVAPLTINDQFQTVIEHLRYTQLLSCKDVEQLRDMEFFTVHKDGIFFRIRDYILNDDQWNTDEFHSFGQLMNYACVRRSLFWYYVLIGGTILLFLLLALLIVLCVWYRRRKARRMNIIMPEGRTYRETQIVMQIENHNLLKTDL